MMKLLLSILLVFAGMGLHAGECYIPEVGRSVKPHMKVLQTERRSGYECRYVAFDVERAERINAYLLVPDHASAKQECPAVVMLHDHGARFDIGKEKLVKPMTAVLPYGSEDHIARSAQQWVDKNFDRVYLADSLASLGYVVLVADALYWGERSSDEAQRWSELTYGDVDKKSVKDTVKALKNIVYDGQRLLYDRHLTALGRFIHNYILTGFQEISEDVAVHLSTDKTLAGDILVIYKRLIHGL